MHPVDTTASRNIIVTDDLMIMEKDVNDSMLVLFDIDLNMIFPKVSMALSEFSSLLEDLLPQFVSYEMKGMYLDHLKFWIHLKAPVSPSQDTLANLIERLHKASIPTLALTSRCKIGSEQGVYITKGDLAAEAHLSQAGVSLKECSNPFASEPLPESVKPSFNIFFANKTSKGDFIRRVFENCSYRPSEIRVSDDSSFHLEAILEAAKNLGIKCTGYHNKSWLKLFPPKYNEAAAIIQFSHLCRGEPIPSDEEAAILATHHAGDLRQLLQETVRQLCQNPQRLNEAINALRD